MHSQGGSFGHGGLADSMMPPDFQHLQPQHYTLLQLLMLQCNMGAGHEAWSKYVNTLVGVICPLPLSISV